LTRCTKLVAILDGFIQTEAHEDVALLASWASMKRARRNPSRRKAIEHQTTAVKEIEANARPAEPIRDPARLLPAVYADLGVTTHASAPIRDDQTHSLILP
jgi:hypothetical protein